MTPQLTAPPEGTPVPRGFGGSEGDRPLRRDAEVNLARILVAAGDVFAEHGYDASMEQIAGRAGVGVGTLYRRFPNKGELVGAVIAAAHDRTQRIAESVLADSSPAEGVFEFLRRCIAAPSCWRVIAARAPWTDDTATSALSRIAPLVDTLLERAKHARTIRADVEFTDLAVVLMSVRAVADLCDPHVPHSSARYLELVLDGLRPGGHPWANPPMAVAQLGAILTDRPGEPLRPPAATERRRDSDSAG
ncbi:MAG TPA: TetR/AcrR family transcriptional regulator [Acidimicrobiales bacterium]|nr:TetR/AcrR family transcriptional regulator [Acidimicrobiales bacterium]